jgi:cytochrome d ubiquinol oxidase subunit II
MLWGLLWAVYFMLDGFDLGLGALLPVLAKNDSERRIIYNSAGPFWDGNEVWLIAAGGVTFAAFPTAYAVMFSSLYSALMLLLFALILRGVAFEFRSKEEAPQWRGIWDLCMIVGSFLPALLLGVAFANIFKGIPIDAEGVFHGTLLTLLNPYGLLGGVFFVCMFLMHGALWAVIKTEGPVNQRAQALAPNLWVAVLITAVCFLIATAFATRLYDNYISNPFFFIIPIAFIPLLAVAALVMVRIYMARAQWWKAWFSSCVMIVAVTFFGIVGLFPNILPSSLNPAFSLTIYNASSSPLTLKIMLGVALIFVPIVIAYQVWTYNLFKEKVSEEDLAYDEAY